MPTFEERWHPWSLREGLVEVSALTQAVANQAVLRSVPRIADAMRLAERVEERLGGGGYRDPTAGPSNWHLYVRDRSDARWLVPPALLRLEVGWAPPEILIPAVPGSEEVDPAPPPAPRPDVLPGPVRRPGSMVISEGAANLSVEYGADGRKGVSGRTAGDSWTWGFHYEDRPFAVDPLVKPPQTLPISVFCRDDLDASGLDLDTLAAMLVAMDPGATVRGRVLFPAPMPGGVGAAAGRGLCALREALWHGRIGDEAGWVVIDAWSGTVHAAGSDLGTAFAAWRARVSTTQPLPPRPAPAPDVDPPAEPPSASRDEATGTARFSTGTVTITGPQRPPVDWPAARSENVPAFAAPLPPSTAIPPAFARHGFARAVRLVGNHGAVSTAFVRDEPDGFVLVGEGAVDAVNPATIGRDLRRLLAERRAEMAEFPDLNPTEDDTARVFFAHVWDSMGREPRLHMAGESWGRAVEVRGFDGDALRWQAVLATMER